jgi:hypothetical protein
MVSEAGEDFVAMHAQQPSHASVCQDPPPPLLPTHRHQRDIAFREEKGANWGNNR